MAGAMPEVDIGGNDNVDIPLNKEEYLGDKDWWSAWKDSFMWGPRVVVEAIKEDPKAAKEYLQGNLSPIVKNSEGKKVLKEMESHGLKKGKNNLQVYVMCEIPSNVILADEFSKIFDGFSIGSNDLTQLTLGLDRDSALVAPIYDENNEGVKRLIKHVIDTAKKNKRKIGICGQAPSDFPEFAAFLVDCGIDSISLNPDTVIKTTLRIAEEEKKLKRRK